MLDSVSAVRTAGVPPAADFWTVTAISGTNTISLKLINVSNIYQFAAAIQKLLNVLDAAANVPTAGGWTVDVTKI